MDPVVMALPAGADWTRLDSSLAQVGGHPARHWDAEDSHYVVVQDLPDWAALHRAVRDADVEPLGAARLVFDPEQTPAPDQDVVSTLPDHLEVRLEMAPLGDDPLPSQSPEVRICPECGGMDGVHFSPPH
jgi:hypothetical protein